MLIKHVLSTNTQKKDVWQQHPFIWCQLRIQMAISTTTMASLEGIVLPMAKACNSHS